MFPGCFNVQVHLVKVACRFMYIFTRVCVRTSVCVYVYLFRKGWERTAMKQWHGTVYLTCLVI